MFFLQDNKKDKDEEPKIILGVDPGTRITGYGIIQVKGREIIPLDFGCIRPPVKAMLSERYLIIFESLSDLISEFSPSEMAIEMPFVSKNHQSALKLGSAQGVAFVAAKRKNMRIFGYSPREVKCSIAGTGNAGKNQILSTVTRFLGLIKPPNPQDAADALACAICHSRSPDRSHIGAHITKEL